MSTACVKAPARGVQREPVPDADQIHSALAKLPERLAQATGRPAEPIQSPDDDPLQPAGAKIIHQLRHTRSLHRPAGELVRIPLGRPVVLLGPGAEAEALPGGTMSLHTPIVAGARAVQPEVVKQSPEIPEAAHRDPGHEGEPKPEHDVHVDMPELEPR